MNSRSKIPIHFGEVAKLQPTHTGPAEIKPTSSRRGNLPVELTSLIGRQHDVTSIERLLREARLVTLTGAGGSGKTRLALRVGAQLVPNFPDGVWLVQLASLADSSLVPRAVATALGVRGSGGESLVAALATALASRRLLTVLDNCEHLVGACARLVETLLGACPHLRVVSTSREPLRISGEVIWRVPPLAFPGPYLLPAETLMQVEAVALFLERARSRRPDFALTAENAPTVATICRRLDGLPLAIELAAAQVGTLSPTQIADRLDDAPRLLAGGHRTVPRQETLHAALDWSYNLLSEEERTLFRRLSAFAGSFELEALGEICSCEGIERAEMVRLLGSLVEKSLVEAQIDTRVARYRLLEPIRQYARDRAVDHEETGRLCRRHAHYFLRLAEAAEPKLMSGERGPWMERLALEQDNLRAALTWSRRSTDPADIEVGLRLAGALTFFWNFRGEVKEGLEWTEALLARGQDAAPAVRAKALYGAGELGWLAGQTILAQKRAGESEVLWRTLGNKRWLAYTLQSLPMAVDNPRAEESVAESMRLFKEVGDAWGAALALATPDYFSLMTNPEARARGEARLVDGLARARAVADDWVTAHALNMLGDLARSQGDDAVARKRYEAALELLHRQDLTGTVPSLLHNLGHLALHAGDTRRALRYFRESLALFRDQGDQRGIVDCLDGLAGVRAAMGHPVLAARLFGATEALREVAGFAIWPGNVADFQRSMHLVREQLEERQLAVEWAKGRAIPLHQAVAEVLTDEPSGPSRGDVAESDLTPREREVARLVAQGLTNRHIGAQLFITEGTARLHVKHILHKLGFTSRAQIASWAAEHELTSDTSGR